MAYSYTNSQGKQYFLNTKEVQLNAKTLVSIYYFSKDERPETACDLPDDRIVVENAVTGLPLVKKRK